MSMELNRIPNCSLLYLHSNDMNSLKSLFLKKSFSYKYNCLVCNRFEDNQLLCQPMNCATSTSVHYNTQVMGMKEKKDR